MKEVRLIGLPDFPLISEDDDIGQIIVDEYSELFEYGDVLVIAQKIVSKAECRIIDLRDLEITTEAEKLAEKTGRAVPFCQAILNESAKVVETKGKVIVTDMPNGMRVTSAGIDKSNIDTGGGNKVILLPFNSDKSAKEIYKTIKEKTGKEIPVIINDSLGHPYRGGSVGKAIGLFGIAALENPNSVDLNGNKSMPIINRVDELSSAASILMGQGSESVPAILIKGADYTPSESSSIEELIIKQDK
ncbi:MAG: coenzyme F420-0:L-glutamate ligase [Proteobacteria bacterium]|nr:coenzyme F420-0:L-glutamate ligase [Pseudomonadota bacterium]